MCSQHWLLNRHQLAAEPSHGRQSAESWGLATKRSYSQRYVRRPTPSTRRPRDAGAGVTHDIDGKMWLQVNEIQQAGTEGFKDVRGQEKWMPDNGGSWNGGQWLHEPKE